ncbi:Asp-tRNA(Asn)/Glu-tRNA(Gln) amidotransferase subunit GatC [Clostridium botulinum]|uniref:Aspartyl/glutamyl-tRNA(Asn/Gln) amidotransferase subunit C n=1 Tax=Clostridium botulinum C/D str. DC5 TaxID=1443128 RepID=A0A0A0IK06_CLOBO|nr:Asp-tRNA(Asn)/Glu-tRNA(Gln) amidotransferase subunit GatC [Clostridium botulinum]KEI00190.1 glutamyl-tRNA amidotransferase [Clostridium botulinum C/D str. BKT75002]KEI09348.1 glutamyl-tRNA amidotransferase [Clostridium botulinum C/D str. BKT2873]KGM94662.1 glutamyl-tRNA amidotransferase [Clostridium botulinum D str. CCUG 7971]KGM99895.1 glutamyl-tRNA amidotransferase [Clostridium botulinum C/D str. DC5]KOC49400.1 glutamyl-tRNA amidotransferase [Clostridium botulinum]
MVISKKDVEYTAKLAKLSFNEEEEKALIDDLNKILDNMEKLNELNTNDINITVNPYYIENQYREDEEQESLTLDMVLKNSPDSQNEYIVVPKVIE